MTIEKFPIALKEDLRKVDRELKHEVANLNLQLEASKRVTNGVTFGTNFDSTFGMEIDFTRTFSAEPLSIGDTLIVVDDYAGFIIGQEVTIFDDVNLERRVIRNINNYTLTVDALNKEYKAGVNIARSMAIENVTKKSLEFGVWGTYGTDSIDVELVISDDRSGAVTGKYRTALIDGDLFILIKGLINSNWTSSVMKKNANGDWIVFSGVSIGGVSANAEYTQIVAIDNLLWIFSLNSLVIKDPKSGATIKNTQTINYATDPQIIVDEVNNKFYLWKANVLHEYKWDDSYTVTLIKTSTPFASGSAGANVITKTNNDFYVARLYNNNLTIDTSAGHFSTSLSDGWTSNTIAVPSGLMHLVALFEVNGDLHLTYLKSNGPDADLCEKVSANNGLTWSSERVIDTISFPDSTFRNNYAEIDGDGNVFVTFLKGYQGKGFWCKFNKRLNDWENKIQHMNKTLSGISSNASFGISYSRHIGIKRPLVALYNFGTTTQRLYVEGEWRVGYGAPVTINDVRFTTKQTKEAVAWIQHDEGLTITEGDFNGRPMDLSVVDNETQLVGIKFDDTEGELRFTMERSSIDDDVKVTRILGGVE